jgi:long-chain acyl-CoA synthetase
MKEKLGALQEGSAQEETGTLSGDTFGTLEHWSQQKPDEIAIVEGNRATSWSAWNDEANALAQGLKARGITAGDIVVVRLQIRTEWPIISAALGKLGCRLLGLNWRLTIAEIRYVLANSGARAFICDDAEPGPLLQALKESPVGLAVSLDAQADGFTPYASLIAERGAALFSAGNPSLIIYTSGTTGLPKGVEMGAREGIFGDRERSELREYQRSLRDERSQHPGDVTLLTMPMHHSAGPSIVWSSVACGNKMILLRRFDPEEVLRLIERHRVSGWRGVPTMYKRIASLPKEVLARYDVSSIRMLGVGAAPMPFALKKWVIAHFGPCLFESYGSTETGMITVLPPQMQEAKPGSSGRPFRHVHISIRNEEGAELPAGETGEIWVKTPVVIRRYLNADPLGEDVLDSNGFFRTGDIGRVDEEGYLFITDRAKDMIVSGGVNIYPAEIEAAIVTHPLVQDAAVIGIPDPEFGEQVKAFIELKPGGVASEASIIAHCSKALASYKRPKSVEIVTELPRNAMGKVLKRQLRDPYWEKEERRV